MTTLKLGYTNPLTDTFGAHPVLGGPLDLNDGTTFVLVSPEGLELAPPPRTLVPAGNIRTQGERATRALYRHNREATARVLLGPGLAAGATYAQFIAQVRSLLAWLNAPPAVPVTLQYQPFSASSPVYLDVVGCAHDIPTDEDQWLKLQLEPIEIVFICRPGLRGDRVTLSNLCPNPGFEQGSGPAVQAFTDAFANVNAYAVQAGSAPSVSASVMTIPNGGRVAFGSTAWAALNLWQVRWQWATSLAATFYLHYTDANNYLAVVIQGTTLVLNHVVGGTTHQLASVTATLTNGNFYWLQATQFPTSPSTPSNGNPPDVAATLFNDTGPGSIGTQVATSGTVPTFDSVTALAGRPQLAASGAALAVGGAFSNVHTVSLFGPGAWSFLGLNAAATGQSSGAWEQTAANTYPNGPVTSYGAARIDLAPAGQVDAYWNLYNGGSPTGTQAMVCFAAGNTIAAAVWVKSSGLGSAAVLRLDLRLYDASGSLLLSGTLATLTGNQSAWAQLSGTVVAVAGTAYLDLRVHVVDTTAGASANGTVWFDNAQVWNVTTTGIALGSMPYCELRFPASPATLVVSGLLGDLPAPALVQLGTYLASWAKGSTLTYALGRRAAVSSAFVGASPAVGFFGTTFTPQGTAVLDPTSYGGYYVKATVGTAGWNPRALSPKASDGLGTYHVLSRYRTFDATPAGVQVRAKTEELLDPWYQDVNTLKSLGTYYGPYVNPLSAANVWTIADTGQVQIPPFLRGALRDDTQVFEVPRAEWVGTTGGGAEGDASFLALLPVDGSLVAGVLNNPANSPISAVAASWLWVYLDGLLVNRAGSGPGGSQDGPGWMYSIEASPLAAPGHGGGGPGTQQTGAVNVNNGADPYLTLDPTVGIAGQSGGINQVVGYVSDNAGDVLGLHAEVSYSPLYLWPR